MKMKRFMSIAVVAILVLAIASMALFSCKTTTESEAVEETLEEAVEEATEEITEEISEEAVEEELKADITVWAYPVVDGEDKGKYFTGIGEKLEEMFPGVNVTFEELTLDAGPDKVTVAIATGATPDILIDYNGRIMGYAGQDALVPIDDVISELSYEVSDNIKDSVKINNESYMVPIASVDYLWGLNKTLAEKYGVMDFIPEDYTSWSFEDFKDFLVAAKEAGKEDGIYGTALYAGSQSSDAVTFGMLMAAGARVFNDDYTEIILNSPEGVEALEFLVSLVEEGLVAPNAATMTDSDSNTLMWNSKILMDLTIATWGDPKLIWDWLEGEEGMEPFELTWVSYPSWQGKTPTKTDAGIRGICIFKNDNDEMKIKTAKEWIKLLVTDNEAMAELITNLGTVPLDSAITVYQDNELYTAEIEKSGNWKHQIVVNWNGGKSYWSEIRAVFYPEIQAAYSGEKSAQQALDDFVEKANKIVKNNE